MRARQLRLGIARSAILTLLTVLVAACAGGSSTRTAAEASSSPSPGTSALVVGGTPGLGFASPLPGTVASPGASVTQAIPDFNVRLGTNRPAAEASLALSRDLYSDGSFWEVYVRTTPAAITSGYDPTDPASY